MILKAKIKDIPILAKFATKVWEGSTMEEMISEFTEILGDNKAACFLVYEDDKAVGFAVTQLRNDYVEGTTKSPVGYLEGIYIEEEYRRNGLARRLVEACEDWARENGAKEFASDCEIDNLESLEFHLSIGFKEANRIICFTKNL